MTIEEVIRVALIGGVLATFVVSLLHVLFEKPIDTDGEPARYERTR